jgi:hypothetical protein
MYTLKITTLHYNELTDSHFSTCKKYNALELKDSTIKILTYSCNELESIIKDVNEKINQYKKDYTDYSITIHSDNALLMQYESEYFIQVYNMIFSTHIDNTGKFTIEKNK